MAESSVGNGSGRESPSRHCRIRPRKVYPPPQLPALCPGMESALIEWDWRMQDGIETEREAVTYAAAIERTIARGSLLLNDLQESGVALEELAVQWHGVQDIDQAYRGKSGWRRSGVGDALAEAHHLRRRIALSNPQAAVGPLVFAKHITGDASHQLTQYYGRCARGRWVVRVGIARPKHAHPLRLPRASCPRAASCSQR